MTSHGEMSFSSLSERSAVLLCIQFSRYKLQVAIVLSVLFVAVFSIIDKPADKYKCQHENKVNDEDCWHFTSHSYRVAYMISTTVELSSMEQSADGAIGGEGI